MHLINSTSHVIYAHKNEGVDSVLFEKMSNRFCHKLGGPRFHIPEENIETFIKISIYPYLQHTNRASQGFIITRDIK